MKVSIGGDKFVVLKGTGNPDISKFPSLPPGFNGWLYFRKDRANELYYFNYLGYRVPFCGNAARVLGYLLADGKKGDVDVEASGLKKVKVLGNTVGITLSVKIKNQGDHSVVDMESVRHLVFPVKKAYDFPLKGLYDAVSKSGLTYHINVYSEVGNRIFVRTWEYGYPYEPLGCATGTLASAADYLVRVGLHSVETIVRSGDVGRVSGDGTTFTLWNRLYFLP